MSRVLAAQIILFLPHLAGAPAVGDVLSLVSQDRSVTARAVLSPQPPDPPQSLAAAEAAPDFGAFTKSVEVSVGAGGPGGGPLGTGSATQTSTILGSVVHAAGRVAASGFCLLSTCGSAEAKSKFSIRFVVREPAVAHLIGGVATETGAPELVMALTGPGVSLVSSGNGGSEDVDLEALLTPGEYSLEARAVAQSGQAGSYRMDVSFTSELVGVESARWSKIKQLYR